MSGTLMRCPLSFWTWLLSSSGAEKEEMLSRYNVEAMKNVPLQVPAKKVWPCLPRI